MLHDLFYVRDFLDVGSDVELDQGAHCPLLHLLTAWATRSQNPDLHFMTSYLYCYQRRKLQGHDIPMPLRG